VYTGLAWVSSGPGPLKQSTCEWTFYLKPVHIGQVICQIFLNKQTNNVSSSFLEFDHHHIVVKNIDLIFFPKNQFQFKNI